MYIRFCQKGISLIELIIFIVIVSIALAGMLVVNQTIGHSADALVRKQALTVAESLLEEIESRTFYGGPTCTGTLGPDASRSSVSTVCDYHGYSTTAGILDFSTNTVVSGLSAYNVSPSIAVVPINIGELGTILPASAVRITVHITDPAGKIYDATGYRMSY